MLLQNIENYVDENNFVDGTKDIERKIPQNVCVPCKDIYTLPINIKWDQIKEQIMSWLKCFNLPYQRVSFFSLACVAMSHVIYCIIKIASIR